MVLVKKKIKVTRPDGTSTQQTLARHQDIILPKQQ